MDYEREKGRILGHRRKRLEAIEFARKMVPILAKARREIPWEKGKAPSNNKIMHWLNGEALLTDGPRFPTQYGGKWHPQTLTRLLDCHFGGITEVENEYDIAFEVVSYLRSTPVYRGRKEILEELGDIEATRAAGIKELVRLAADLRGEAYVEEPIPPPLKKLKSRGRAELMADAAARIMPRGIDAKKIRQKKTTPEEVQLNLFRENP
jgi:hypothetical protein